MLKKLFKDTGPAFDILLDIAGILALALLAVLLAGCGGMQGQDSHELERNVKALMDAVEQRSIQKVKELVAIGVDMNARNAEGDIALHIAASMGCEEIAGFLIEKGADVNARGRHGDSPLHRAAFSMLGRKIELLLIGRGADVNARNDFGQTALHDAAMFGNSGGILSLIANDADVNVRDYDGRTPLDYAADPLTGGGFGLLEEFGGESGEPYRAEMVQAVRQGSLHWLNKLVKAGADLETRERFHGWKLLHVAAWCGQKESASYLLSKGAYVDEEGMICMETPLHLAAQKGHKELAELLIVGDAAVNVADASGETPLHTAAAGGHAEIVKLLLANRADASAKDDKSRTPLDLAREEGHTEIVKLLQGGE